MGSTGVLGTPRRSPDATSASGQTSRRAGGRPLFPLAIAAAIGLGLAVRASYVLSADFPLNDGGLFYAMVRDLQHARYRLPAVTSYNAADIPFAYSPLGFYVAGWLADLTPLSLLEVFRFLPLTATGLTVAAFALLARTVLARPVAVIAAVLAFALLPRSYIWLLMGGGVTRSLGLLFAILALQQVYLLYTRRRARFVAPAAALAGLTVLSHLETGKFLVFGIALFFLAYGRHRQGVLHSTLVAVGAVALTAPWWVAVVAQHGVAPFLAASETAGSVLADSEMRRQSFAALLRLGVVASEPFFPILGTLALLGALTTLVDTLAALPQGRFLFPTLPIWWGSIFVLEPRGAATFVTVPMALLAGVGVAEVLVPLLLRTPGGTPSPPQAVPPLRGDRGRRAWRPHRARAWPAVLVLGFLLGYATFAALTRRGGQPESGERRALVALSSDERAAMRWVAAGTPPSSRFLVIGDVGNWQTDAEAEWFPVLAERVSVATPQGYEWLPGRAFARRERSYEQARGCADRDASCLERWAAGTGSPFTHVYVHVPAKAAGNPADQCCALAASLAADPRYALVYEGPGVTIFARR